MIQVKNNLTGSFALFKTLSQAYKFWSRVVKTINIEPYNKKYFVAAFKKSKRIKVGFGNVSIVVSEVIMEKP